MDYRARFPGIAPLTETGDPADCSWLTKAFAAECAFGSMQTEFHEAKTVPGILRVAQGITFAIVTGIVAYAILA